MNHVHNDTHTCCGMLLQPPPGDLTGPYPALPYLKAYAELQGHTVRVRDLGIESLVFFTREDKLRCLLDRAAAMRSELESGRFLDPVDQHRYRLLVAAAWVATRPQMIPEALGSFKDRDSFFNYRLYRESCRVLDAFFGLLSALHFPTVVTPSEYPTAQALNSMEAVLAHRQNRLNPYVEYYEEILLPALAAETPKVIGISMEFAAQSVQALVLGRLLKDRFPGIHVTMGGAYLSQWVLLMGDQHLSELFTCTDSVVCGEGELAFARLLEGIETDGVPRDTPNLIRRDSLTGGLLRPAFLEYPDIGDLPAPDYSDLNLGAYLIPEPVIPYAISRGCYWGKCVFCQNRYGENRMRRYQTVPVEKAVAEMAQLAAQHRTNHFNFSNDVVDPPYLKRLSETLIASGKDFVWNTDLRAEKAFTREACHSMARAGLNSVAIGFESGCQETLDAMDKGKSVPVVAQVMKDLYGEGIATQAMGFFGFPGESEEKAEFTVAFLEDNADSISYYVIGLLMVVPGSRMHEDPQKYGVSSISYEGNRLMAPQPVWRSDTRISGAGVNRLYQRLSRLEDRFAIHEYPYVGALCTNHSFLYFKTGPDALKRLKQEERERQLKLPRILAINDKHARVKKLKSLVPRYTVPLLVYRSPFAVDRVQPNVRNAGNLPRLTSGSGSDYVVGASDLMVRIEDAERRFLAAIDGRAHLQSLLQRYQEAGRENLVMLLLELVSHGVVVM